MVYNLYAHNYLSLVQHYETAVSTGKSCAEQMTAISSHYTYRVTLSRKLFQPHSPSVTDTEKNEKERKKKTDHGMQSARAGLSHAGRSFHNQRPSFYVASRSRRQSWVLYLSAPSSVFIYPRLPQSATAPTAPQSSPQLHSRSAAATETPTSSSMIITSARTTATGPAACLWPAPCCEECVAVVVAVLWTSGG